MACLAAAGAVQDNCVTLTNGGNWVVSGAGLEKSTGITRVKIINDFIGMAYGLLTLHPEARWWSAVGAWC